MVAIELGPCHYGGMEEEATTMAVREDGTGWIGVCDEHRQQAEQDGFTIDDDAAVNAEGGGQDEAEDRTDDRTEEKADAGAST